MTDAEGATTDDDPDVLVAGETLVDFLPDDGGATDPADPPTGLADVERFLRRPGGAPANVAVALARLGPAPWFWTRVGEDPFGDFLAETLAEAGLPGRFVERDPDAGTTLAFVSPGGDPAGDDGDDGEDDGDEPDFTFYRDATADTRLAAGAVPDDVLEAVDWCYVGGVALAAEPARSAVIDLVERAHAAGCTVAFDPNARPELWEGEEFADVVGRMLRRVDVVAATPADLRSAGVEAVSPEALAGAVCERGPHTAFLTLGADGALARASDRAPWGPAEVRHGGYPVEAVDPTGAGDAFVAGAIRSLADAGPAVEEPLAEAVAFANAVAAASTAGRGAMAALPDRETAAALREGRPAGGRLDERGR